MKNFIKKKIKSKIQGLALNAMSMKNIEAYPFLQDSMFGTFYNEFINHNIEIVDFDEKEDLIYLKKDNLYFVTTPSYPWIAYQVFCRHDYFINPQYLKYTDYAVFDMGMNRGYSTLYFANQPWCKEVYGFELEENVFKIAQKNISLNIGIKNKTTLFSFGLGNQDGKIKTYYAPHMDAICTTDYEYLKISAPKEMDRIIETENIIKKTSSILKEIVEKNNIAHIILKIDVEGGEYDIFDDIMKEYPDFLNKVDIIIGEVHHVEVHRMLDYLVSKLKPFGLNEVSSKRIPIAKACHFLFIKN